MVEDAESSSSPKFRRFSQAKLGKYVRALSETIGELRKRPAFAKTFGGQQHSVAQLGLATKNEVFHLPRDKDSRDTFFELLDATFWSKLGIDGLDRHPLRVVFKAFNQKVR